MLFAHQTAMKWGGCENINNLWVNVCKGIGFGFSFLAKAFSHTHAAHLSSNARKCENVVFWFLVSLFSSGISFGCIFIFIIKEKFTLFENEIHSFSGSAIWRLVLVSMLLPLTGVFSFSLDFRCKSDFRAQSNRMCRNDNSQWANNVLSDWLSNWIGYVFSSRCIQVSISIQFLNSISIGFCFHLKQLFDSHYWWWVIRTFHAHISLLIFSIICIRNHFANFNEQIFRCYLAKICFLHFKILLQIVFWGTLNTSSVLFHWNSRTISEMKAIICVALQSTLNRVFNIESIRYVEREIRVENQSPTLQRTCD